MYRPNLGQHMMTEHSTVALPESTEDHEETVTLVDTAGDAIEDVMQHIPGGSEKTTQVISSTLT